MGEGYTVDIAAVRDVVGKFGAPADKLEDARAALVAALEGTGGCWGNDEAGQAFAKDYEPVAPDASKFFRELAKGVRDLKKSVEQAMDSYEQYEEDMRESMPGTEIT